MKNFRSIGQVAQELGIPAYKIKYGLETLAEAASGSRQ